MGRFSPSRNDPCPCGSGQKYKRCHERTGEFEPGGKYYGNFSGLSLDARNFILLNAIPDIFGLSKEGDWEKLKRQISGNQIAEFYQLIADLWPINTDFSSLLPNPEGNLRALYLGDIDPEPLIRNTLRFSLYADELLIVSPWMNPNCVAPKFNPIENPDQYKFDTLRTLYVIMLLEPWIRARRVRLIPDPGDFDYALRQATWESAEKRRAGMKLDHDDPQFREMALRTRLQSFMPIPEDHLEDILRNEFPRADDKMIESFKLLIRHKRENDPIFVDQDYHQLGDGQMLIVRAGANLEMATYICQAVGAFPYTNMRIRKQEIIEASKDISEVAKTWTPLSDAFQALKFEFLNNVDPKFALEMREDGRLENFRSFLRRVWTELGGEPNQAKMDDLVIAFSDELTHEYQGAKAEWEKIDQDLIKWGGTGVGAALISGSFMPSFWPVAGSFVLLVTELIKRHHKIQNYRKTVPMSVFIDLDDG